MNRPILVSACLLGLQTRYDGRSKQDDRVLRYLREHHCLPVPVCPEQLAGLPTPRAQVQFLSGDGRSVLDGCGQLCDTRKRNLNQAFIRGAAETAKIASITGCDQALLKERSPSCGARQIYRQDTLVGGQGVTAAMLKRNGVHVFSEEDL